MKTKEKKLSGLSRETVEAISRIKKEPKWMLEKRLQGLEWFYKKELPPWASIPQIELEKLTYYSKTSEKTEQKWEDVPQKIKQTFEKLGIPEIERKFLAGVGAQHESEVAYQNLKEEFEKQGVIFLSMDEAVQKHPEMVKKYFGSVVPASDNKFSALNTAFWSGGVFIYVPKDVEIEIPLQAYFWINAKKMGQFERTLIIADEESEVHYLEGCSSPIYSSNSLHAAVVELIVKKNAKLNYTTIQNWSQNVYNFVTKRAHAYENAIVDWTDANLGSKITMKYPTVHLLEKGAKANILSLSFANKNQRQETGGKAIHSAPDTCSRIVSKSVSKNNGYTSYRGLVEIAKGATNAVSNVKCDALLLDKNSRSDTYPAMKIEEKNSATSHEAYTGKISEEQLFYLQTRGFSEEEATTLIVLGFVSEVINKLPIEYALELTNLIKMETTGEI